MQVCEGQRCQGGHLVTKVTSATSSSTVAAAPTHTKDPVSLVSAGPSFFSALSLAKLNGPLCATEVG